MAEDITGSWPFPDWGEEARRKVAERQARRDLRAADRAVMAEARDAGKAIRHANRLRQASAAGDTTSTKGDRQVITTQTRDGGAAVVVQHCAVFGRLESPVRKFRVEDVRPYAQYDRSVCISFVEPRKRNGKYIRMTPDGVRFATVEIQGRTVYDSRRDVPIDMGKWRETSSRFTRYEVSDLA